MKSVRESGRKDVKVRQGHGCKKVAAYRFYALLEQSSITFVLLLKYFCPQTGLWELQDTT